jgi:hypothetical protein
MAPIPESVGVSIVPKPNHLPPAPGDVAATGLGLGHGEWWILDSVLARALRRWR